MDDGVRQRALNGQLLLGVRWQVWLTSALRCLRPKYTAEVK